MQRLAIFASGAGSNAAKIIEYFTNHSTIEIAVVFCNKENAGVLQVAANAHIATVLIEKEKFFRGDWYLPELKSLNIDFIILAGFLWKIPQQLISAYPNKIINIHPALLPKYGGKGMYGNKVHETVIANQEKESGITIHYVNEQYDEGKHIFQISCSVHETDDATSLAAKIHLLEHEHFAKVIEQILLVPSN